MKRRRLAFGHQRQAMLQLLVVFVGLVFAFLVDLQEAFEFQHRSGGAEDVIHAVLALGGDVDGGLVVERRHHLAGHEAIPDQPVELHLIFGQMLLHDFRREGHGGGPDGFVRVLRVLLRLIDVGAAGRNSLPYRSVIRSPHVADGVVGNARGIGAHVGDQTDRAFLAHFDAFIQPLRQHHGALHAEAQLARRLLLQGGGDERRHRVALLLARADGFDDVIGAIERGHDRVGRLPGCRSRRHRRSILTSRAREHRRLLGVQIDVDGPVFLRDEGADLAFALHDHPQRDGLHAAGGESAADFIPEQRGNLVAHQAIEHAARLLRIHQMRC